MVCSSSFVLRHYAKDVAIGRHFSDTLRVRSYVMSECEDEKKSGCWKNFV